MKCASRKVGCQVGSCNYFFGACSAFTHVTACTLAESPCDPFHRKLRQLRRLRCRFDCYRVERTSSRREFHPLKSNAFHGALLRQLWVWGFNWLVHISNPANVERVALL